MLVRRGFMIPLLHKKITRRILRVVFCLFLALLVCLGCIIFIQFYPFPINKVLAKKNYPEVTTLQSGKTGDPINVMILGSRTEVISSFKQAGWEIPDPITPETSTKIAVDSLANLPYRAAPVSNLYLYARKQDLAFEIPTNNVQNRGHIRLWDTHTTINNEEVWLGAASYDRGIELSGTTHLPTHHVAPCVDQERDQVTQDLRPYMAQVRNVQFSQPNLFNTNGGGDWYYTDGMIAILSVNQIPSNKFQTNSAALSIKQKTLQLASPFLNLF